ncbi:MAG: hypothetical protein ACK57E_07680, partial [Erythrobacteraceae bacterium]
DNIFRNLVKAGARVTVVPAKTSFEEVMALKPDVLPLVNRFTKIIFAFAPDDGTQAPTAGEG